MYFELFGHVQIHLYYEVVKGAYLACTCVEGVFWSTNESLYGENRLCAEPNLHSHDGRREF